MIKKISLVTFFVFFLFSLTVHAQMSNFVGNWQNTNNQTNGVTRVRITRNGNNAFAQLWGKCTPNDCDWGRRSATKYASNPTRSEVNNTRALSASFNNGGIRSYVIFTLIGSTTLEAEVFTTYVPGDNRNNYVSKHRFRKSAVTGVLRAPVHVSPRSGSRLTNFPRRVTLDWRAVGGATAYFVEIGTYMPRAGGGGTWSNIQRRVTATQFTHTHVGDQVGRWRVWAVNGNNRAGRKSGWWTFNYRTTSAVLRAPVQVSPANGQVFNRFPRRTVLNWNSVTGAVAYRVQVQFDSNGSWSANYINKRVTASRYEFTFVGAQRGRWRVWAISRSGTEGRKSPWRTFRHTR